MARSLELLLERGDCSPQMAVVLDPTGLARLVRLAESHAVFFL